MAQFKKIERSCVRVVPSKLVTRFFDEKWKCEKELCNSVYKGKLPNVLFEKFLKKMDIPEGPIIDIGCGDGRLSITLAQKGFEVHGVDTSKKALERFKKRAEFLGLASKIKTYTSLGEAKNRGYSGAVIGSVLHYFSPKKTISLLSNLSK